MKYRYSYLLLLILELFVINRLSDLPSGATSWSVKARELMNLQIPSDNFYGPGEGILMIPFSISSNAYHLAKFFYLGLGALGYWQITKIVPNFRLRNLIRLALPLNFYLIWLINSSSDTAFEFCLLIWSCFFLLVKRYNWYLVVTYLLCLTRAGYWAFFMCTSLILFFKEYVQLRTINFKKLMVFPIFILTAIFNLVVYSSPSPALEGGITAYFSYTKYHYLALPKMDMDVFLSGPNGAFSEGIGPKIPDGSTQAEKNNIYQRAAFDSLLTNKKEAVLGWMQKFDSYFFDVQKVPHLPGSYVLNQKEMKISILNERLSWNLVIGNLLFMIYRTVLVLGILLAIGLYLGSHWFQEKPIRRKCKLLILSTPYVFGFIPGILFYTETRFKIVSELLLFPLIAEIFALSLMERKNLKFKSSVRQ